MLKVKITGLILFLLLLFAGILQGQETFKPRVRNFTKEVYGASSQNWSVAQDKEGNIYVANSIGLLEFDGATWTLYPSPNGNIIRAVAVDSTGKIYTSGYQELGYWTRKEYGQLQYTSLKNIASQYFTPNVEYWNILIEGNKVIFQAFTQLLIYENNLITPVNFNIFANSFFLSKGKMLVNLLNSGIYKVSGSVLKPFVTGDFFNDKFVSFILPYEKDDYLIGTASKGIFLLKQGKISVWNTSLNESFCKNQINRGCLTPNGELLVGTILDGVYLLNLEGKLIWKFNTENGLQNNTVLGLLVDNKENIWLALDRGIDLVTPSSGLGISFFPVEKIGAVYTAGQYQNHIYLGTNQGLYVSREDSGGKQFDLVPGTQGQVWDIKIINNQMIVGHNSGTFLLSDGKIQFISNISGAFSFVPDPTENESFLQSTYSNLVKYKIVGGKICQYQIIYNFNELIRYIELDHLGNIWAGHMHRGIFRLRYNANRDSVRIIRYYGQNSVFGKDNNLHVFKVEDRMVFTTGERLYTFDDLNDTIVPYNQLNRALGEYARATRIIPAPDHLYWFITDQLIGLLKINNADITVIKEFPYALFDNQLIRDYENIIPVNEKEAILCLENGYSWLNASQQEQNTSIREIKPVPHDIYLSDRRGKEFHIPLNVKILKIPNNWNTLHIRLAFPYYTYDKFAFHWHLEGLSPKWSDNRDSPFLTFERLPAGKYFLKVKASDIWGNQSQEFSFPVMVSPPLYWSVAAKILYLFLLGVLLILFRMVLIRKIEKKEKQKREENERELITLKNEKLQADISYKSKELANSTMVIIKKNEILADLKEMLEQQKTLMGSRFPEKYYTDLMRKIEDTLSSRDDWKIFENNFEQAHEEFMKKLKTQFPDLTPKDMRLCAFLRINLSSKEIAPLLGISVRGVENHRYRLRQKMKLDHENNLIEIILNL